MKLFWFFPLHGDGRYLGSAKGGRVVDFDYLRQIALAVDHLGFYGALLPTGRSCEDAWVVASSLLGFTQRLRFLVAVRPGLVAPALAARMAATFDRLSQGRILINVVTGGDPVELAGDGIFHAHDQRYEVTNEFLDIWRRLLGSSDTFDFEGEHLRVQGAKTLFEAVQKPYPPLYFGGSSPAAIEVAAKHVDHYLTWGEPVAAVAGKIAVVRAASGRAGRTLRFGIRLHVIVRETEEEAWADAERLISKIDDQTVAKVRSTLARYDSAGQQRMAALQPQGRSRRDLEVSPNLWAGVGLVRAGAGTALVGSAEQVAERMLEYHRAGIESFIFSGYPHLEEAHRVAELLFPLLPLDSTQTEPLLLEKNFTGELMGHDLVPQQPAVPASPKTALPQHERLVAG